VKTAGDMANTLASLDGISGALLYSCIGRSLFLGLKPDAEMLEFSGIFDKAPYHFAYSGAEICPLEDESGSFINHTHGYSLIACVFSGGE
jgi:small ligand-binding sensory domain FIST